VLLSEASGSSDQVGKPVVWNGEIEDCCFQNTVIRLRPAGIPSEYGLTVFQHYYRSKLFAKVAAGVGINHLSAGKFSALPFPLAPIGEQLLIVTELKEKLSLIAAAEQLLENNFARAARLRQSILKQAFEGKLVPQDPNDEPASVLLEQIRASRSLQEMKGKAPTETRTRKTTVKPK
jgi:type I restriction enzyme S subunit